MSPPVTTADYGQVRAFLAVAEALSFSRAAEKLGVTSSALSQTVRGLEERLGVRLLNRTTRSVSLTEAGDELRRRARTAVDELGAALQTAQGARTAVSGVVRVHSFRVAGERILRPMLRDFHRAYPDVVIDVTLDDHVVDPVAGGFDVAIRIGEVIERDMIALRLGPDIRQLAVASPAYLAERDAPAHPHDLAKHKCVRWRWPGQERPYDWEFCENGRWFKVSVDGPLIVNSRDLCIAAAVDGLGVAFASEPDVDGHVKAGRLVPLLESYSDRFPGFFVCYPERRLTPPPVRAFIDALAAAARG